MHHESFDHGVGTAEVFAAAGREVFMVFLAADGRHHDVKAGDVDQLHALPQHDQIGPRPLHNHRVHVAQRGRLGADFRRMVMPVATKPGLGKYVR